MSKEVAKQVGLQIGQKVLYAHHIGNNYGAPIYMSIVTIKDVRILPHNNEFVIDVEEFKGYVDYGKVYTKEQINNMFDRSNALKKQVTQEDTT